MERAAAVEFRWIQGEELEMLEPVLIAHGWASLNPATAKVRAAFLESGEIVGFTAIQLIPHPEPMWIDERFRGVGVAEQMAADVAQVLTSLEIPAVYLIADNPHAEALAKAHGMVRVESPVYAKVNPRRA